MSNREVLCRILYVLHPGIQWGHLPWELEFGSGMACWRQLRGRNEAGVLPDRSPPTQIIALFPVKRRPSVSHGCLCRPVSWLYFPQVSPDSRRHTLVSADTVAGGLRRGLGPHRRRSTRHLLIRRNRTTGELVF